MQRKFANLTYLAVSAVLALGGISTASAEDKALSATGTWTWTAPGRDGGEGRKMTLELKQDGEKLTGKVSSPGRDGGAARETEITDGSVKGTDVAFSVTRELIQLGYCPRMTICHTSGAQMGQIYIPFVNWTLTPSSRLTASSAIPSSTQNWCCMWKIERLAIPSFLWNHMKKSSRLIQRITQPSSIIRERSFSLPM